MISEMAFGLSQRAGKKDVPITAISHKESTAYVNTELKVKARTPFAGAVSMLCVPDREGPQS